MIDYSRIDYPTLRDEYGGKHIHEMYRVTMWPPAIVLDQEGVVRHVHCGYWPTMQRSLARKVRDLLAEDRP